jgi:hypothetical protein
MTQKKMLETSSSQQTPISFLPETTYQNELNSLLKKLPTRFERSVIVSVFLFGDCVQRRTGFLKHKSVHCLLLSKEMKIFGSFGFLMLFIICSFIYDFIQIEIVNETTTPLVLSQYSLSRGKWKVKPPARISVNNHSLLTLLQPKNSHSFSLSHFFFQHNIMKKESRENN